MWKLGCINFIDEPRPTLRYPQSASHPEGYAHPLRKLIIIYDPSYHVYQGVRILMQRHCACRALCSTTGGRGPATRIDRRSSTTIHDTNTRPYSSGYSNSVVSPLLFPAPRRFNREGDLLTTSPFFPFSSLSSPYYLSFFTPIPCRCSSSHPCPGDTGRSPVLSLHFHLLLVHLHVHQNGLHSSHMDGEASANPRQYPHQRVCYQ